MAIKDTDRVARAKVEYGSINTEIIYKKGQ